MQILDAMEFAVYQYDIKHIILDNLQFLMPRKQGKPYDKFDAQDIAIEVIPFQFLSHLT
jgi:twinkle protein